LKQSQDKMKHWYDKDAMVRELKPGEKVIVLLLIPCHPLPVKYRLYSCHSNRLSLIFILHCLMQVTVL
jgi:hypothetical protein